MVSKPWVTIVWNDPVNLMSYVTYVFQKYFGYPKEKDRKSVVVGKECRSRCDWSSDVCASDLDGLQAVGDDRLERPREPDVLRHLRLPEVLRLPEGEGGEADARGAPGRPLGRQLRQPRGDGARRPGHARVRAVGDDGEAGVSAFARHRRSGRIIANFTGFEADLLRSLASQLVELLRNEAAVPRGGGDPLEDLLDFSGP